MITIFCLKKSAGGRLVSAPLFSCLFLLTLAFGPASGRAASGSHLVHSAAFLDAVHCVAPMPGGGLVAFGDKYMFLSSGDPLRWRMVEAKGEANYPFGAKPAGGGSKHVFLFSEGPVQILRTQPGTFAPEPRALPRLISMSAGPIFRFVRRATGFWHFADNETGAMPLDENLVLTFNGGKTILPQPPLEGLTGKTGSIAAMLWLPGNRLAVATSYGKVIMLRVTENQTLTPLWTSVVRQVLVTDRPASHLGIQFSERVERMLPGPARGFWLVTNRNMYLLNADSGRLSATVPGQWLTDLNAPMKRINCRPHKGWMKGAKPGVPTPAEWKGIIAVQTRGAYLFAWLQSSSVPALAIWKVSRSGLRFELNATGVFGPCPILYYREHYYISARSSYRVSFRLHKLVPETLTILVPRAGPWDSNWSATPQQWAQFRALLRRIPPTALGPIRKQLAKIKDSSPRHRMAVMLNLLQGVIRNQKPAAVAH